MHTVSPASEPQTLARLRVFLLATLALGMVGTGLELLLLGHGESVQQWIPAVLLAGGVAIIVWHAIAPSAASVRTLQTVMALFIAAGVLGVGLHYDGNVEFQRELTPAMDGMDLMWKALTGATPVLAPGAMILLGLVGLAHAYRHPCLPNGGAAFRLRGDTCIDSR